MYASTDEPFRCFLESPDNRLLQRLSKVSPPLFKIEPVHSYRDFGYTTRYEGPYDFHTEEELPALLAKIKTISTSAGPVTKPNDLPEDAAGGLHHAIQLSWGSPVRLCTLIADMPCHGREYHSLNDNYPDGCPSGKDPSKLLDELQVRPEVEVCSF